MPKKTGTDLRKLPVAKRPKPTTGQSGGKLELSWEKLNKDERNVLTFLQANQGFHALAAICKGVSRTFTLLRTRNAMRRLVRAELVAHAKAERGVYAATAKGRNLQAVETPVKEKVKATKAPKAAKAPKAPKARRPRKEKASATPPNGQTTQTVVPAPIEPVVTTATTIPTE